MNCHLVYFFHTFKHSMEMWLISCFLVTFPECANGWTFYSLAINHLDIVAKFCFSHSAILYRLFGVAFVIFHDNFGFSLTANLLFSCEKYSYSMEKTTLCHKALSCFTVHLSRLFKVNSGCMWIEIDSLCLCLLLVFMVYLQKQILAFWNLLLILHILWMGH